MNKDKIIELINGFIKDFLLGNLHCSELSGVLYTALDKAGVIQEVRKETELELKAGHTYEIKVEGTIPWKETITFPDEHPNPPVQEAVNQTTTLKQYTSTTLKDEVVFTTQPHRFINCPCGRSYEIRKDSIVCLY